MPEFTFGLLSIGIALSLAFFAIGVRRYRYTKKNWAQLERIVEGLTRLSQTTEEAFARGTYTDPDRLAIAQMYASEEWGVRRDLERKLPQNRIKRDIRIIAWSMGGFLLFMLLEWFF